MITTATMQLLPIRWPQTCFFADDDADADETDNFPMMAMTMAQNLPSPLPQP